MILSKMHTTRRIVTIHFTLANEIRVVNSTEKIKGNFFSKIVHETQREINKFEIEHTQDKKIVHWDIWG